MTNLEACTFVNILLDSVKFIHKHLVQALQDKYIHVLKRFNMVMTFTWQREYFCDIEIIEFQIQADLFGELWIKLTGYEGIIGI